MQNMCPPSCQVNVFQCFTEERKEQLEQTNNQQNQQNKRNEQNQVQRQRQRQQLKWQQLKWQQWLKWLPGLASRRIVCEAKLWLFASVCPRCLPHNLRDH
jgi:hypothetical protein